MLRDFLKWLIIPIETKVREFDAKLLLGCAAAEAGYGVILGHQHEIRRHWRRMPRGVVFDKSVVKANLQKFTEYRKNGNCVVAWCEEGLLLADERDYLNRKIYAPTLEMVNLFFAWGDNQAETVLKKVPEIDVKMERVGNPRIDLLRPELRGRFSEEVSRLQDQHGPFLLINTNFAPYNNIRGMETSLKIQKRSGKIRSAEGERLFLEFVEFKKGMYHAFVSMASFLAEAFPDKKVIIRPHPAENHDNWRIVANRHDNMEVIHDGNIINWLLAAEVTIQNGCTTGIESFLLGRPTVSYQPFESTVYENYLPDVLGVKVTSEERLAKCVRSVCDGPNYMDANKQKQKRKYARRFIENVDGQFCVDRIVKLLPKLPLEPDLLVPSLSGKFYRYVGNIPTSMRLFLRDVKDHFVSGESLTLKKGPQESLAAVQKKIVKQVFPGLEADEVRTAIGSFQMATGRFSGLKVTPFRKSCVVIEPGEQM